jgi:plasmid stabilization system protein ParE
VGYSVIFSAGAERDLDLIFDFLVESHMGFGDSPEASFDRAARRLKAIRRDAATVAKAPHRRLLDDALSPGLRRVTINRATFYFDVDEAKKEVRILAGFFGGEEHRRRMLGRLL